MCPCFHTHAYKITLSLLLSIPFSSPWGCQKGLWSNLSNMQSVSVLPTLPACFDGTPGAYIRIETYLFRWCEPWRNWHQHIHFSPLLLQVLGRVCFYGPCIPFLWMDVACGRSYFNNFFWTTAPLCGSSSFRRLQTWTVMVSRYHLNGMDVMTPRAHGSG